VTLGFPADVRDADGPDGADDVGRDRAQLDFGRRVLAEAGDDGREEERGALDDDLRGEGESVRVGGDGDGGESETLRTHIDEAVGERAGPGERVGNSLEDGLGRRLLVDLAEVLDLETADGERALLLVEPARRLGRRRDDEERDDAVSTSCGEGGSARAGGGPSASNRLGSGGRALPGELARRGETH